MYNENAELKQLLFQSERDNMYLKQALQRANYDICHLQEALLQHDSMPSIMTDEEHIFEVESIIAGHMIGGGHSRIGEIEQYFRVKIKTPRSSDEEICSWVITGQRRDIDAACEALDKMRMDSLKAHEKKYGSRKPASGKRT
jgi:hypothetical protein